MYKFALRIASIVAILVPLGAAGCAVHDDGGRPATVFVTNDDISPVDILLDDDFGGFAFVGTVYPGTTERFDFCECDIGDTLEAVDSRNRIISQTVVEDRNDWIVP